MNRYFSLFNEQLTNGVTQKSDDQKEKHAAVTVWNEREVPTANGGKYGPVSRSADKPSGETVFQTPAVTAAAMSDAAPVQATGPDEQSAINQPGRGSLIVQVSLADRAVPVAGVKVTVRPSGEETIISVMETDNSGRTPELELPAPPKSLSQVPDSKVPPYSLYDVKIEFPGYTTVLDRNVPVFDGIRSIQPAALMPVEQVIGGNPAQAGGGAPEEVIEETEPADL